MIIAGGVKSLGLLGGKLNIVVLSLTKVASLLDAKTIKEHGVHFTPSDIAKYIVQYTYRLIDPDKRIVSVLDPSCGDGELLAAACKLLKANGRIVKLYGIDTDEETLRLAQERLSRLVGSEDVLSLHAGDFLTCEPEQGQALFPTEGAISIPLVDMLVANPPYVRTQVLGSGVSKKIAKEFNLSGKTDLYHAFFLHYLKFIKPDGALGVITSNRYLFTKSGKEVRKHLHENYLIDFIADLGDTKIFDAAVLPALLFAKPGNNSENKTRCVRVYEVSDSCGNQEHGSLVSVLAEERAGNINIAGKTFKVDWGHIRNTSLYKEPWVLATLPQETWLDSVEKSSSCHIGNVAKVKVGIKTTADNVFIRNDWQSLPVENRPESEWVFPLVSSSDAVRWQLPKKPSSSILYPYSVENGRRKVADLESFPKMNNYLHHFYNQLSDRSYVAKANRRWYEIWVPQDPSAWSKKKIVFPDISSCAKFALDTNGYLVDGNCYWIQLNANASEDVLWVILGVANSELMDTYHALAFQNVLYSGKRRYLTQYVEQYPLPDMNADATKKLVEYLKQSFIDSKEVEQSVVDNLVYKAFEVEPFCA